MSDAVKDARRDANFLAQMLDSLPTPIYAKDDQARFIFSNRRHDKLVGRKEEELLGKSDADFYPHEAAQEFLKNDRQVLDKGIISSVEEMANSPDGLTMPVLSRKARMQTNEGGIYLVGANFDLSDVKKREEQYRALAETVPVGVIQLEESGEVSFSNPLFMAYFSDAGDVLNVASITAAMGHPANFPGEANRFECTLRNRRHEERRVLVISSGWLFLSKGQRRSAIVSIVDISENTELKRINEEILRLNRELAANMQQLKNAQEALVKKGQMEQMGQLTATIAHELRNPLGAVRTSVFLVERKLKGKDLGLEAQMTRINHGVTRCDAIITQLLDFSRTKHINASPQDLDQWLAHMLEEESKKMAACVTMSVNLGLATHQVPFDPARLERAIVNLINNAAEAMVGNGDAPLKGVTAAPEICVSTRISGEQFEIEVADNGPGMTEEVLAKVKEPLFTTKSFGTGLGIPAVEQIALQHGGKLVIASEPGKGAKFTLSLPLVSPEKEKAA